jgi:drug/metabolite transporter (DMT)-like permease
MSLRKPVAIGLLLFAATLFAGNHVAARFAFDDGAGLLLALCARSGIALVFMAGVAFWKRQSFRLSPTNTKRQILIGGLIAIQSWALYSSVALIPVPVALLLVNTWPMLYIVSAWVVGRSHARVSLGVILMAIIFGLILVLLPGTAAQTSNSNWMPGVALGLLASVCLGVVMWITNFHMADVPGGVRSTYTMLIVFVSMLVAGFISGAQTSFALPESTAGFGGLVFLAMFYGIASTVLFVLAPKLDMANNAPALNFEPVAALLLSFLILDQVLSAVQLVGVVVVVSGIVAVGVLKD